MFYRKVIKLVRFILYTSSNLHPLKLTTFEQNSPQKV